MVFTYDCLIFRVNDCEMAFMITFVSLFVNIYAATQFQRKCAFQICIVFFIIISVN